MLTIVPSSMKKEVMFDRRVAVSALELSNTIRLDEFWKNLPVFYRWLSLSKAEPRDLAKVIALRAACLSFRRGLSLLNGEALFVSTDVLNLVESRAKGELLDWKHPVALELRLLDKEVNSEDIIYSARLLLDAASFSERSITKSIRAAHTVADAFQHHARAEAFRTNSNSMYADRAGYDIRNLEVMLQSVDLEKVLLGFNS